MTPEEETEPTRDEYPSPLRSLITELHEIHHELRAVGFTRQSADGIVASILFDAMINRPTDEDDYDEDEDENDNDSGDLSD